MVQLYTFIHSLYTAKVAYAASFGAVSTGMWISGWVQQKFKYGFYHL